MAASRFDANCLGRIAMRNATPSRRKSQDNAENKGSDLDET
jgi:hypothetical protein